MMSQYHEDYLNKVKDPGQLSLFPAPALKRKWKKVYPRKRSDTVATRLMPKR